MLIMPGLFGIPYYYFTVSCTGTDSRLLLVLLNTYYYFMSLVNLATFKLINHHGLSVLIYQEYTRMSCRLRLGHGALQIVCALQ